MAIFVVGVIDMMEHITFISAGAGSGKTYRLSLDLERSLSSKESRPSGVIATTFTKLAAGELRERARQRLNEFGHTAIANQMDQAMIGTVNGICGQLLKRFAFEAGLSPHQTVIEENAAKQLFSKALEESLNTDKVQTMNRLADRLSIDDWRGVVKDITEKARSNGQIDTQISDLGLESANSLLENFPPTTDRDLNDELRKAIQSFLEQVEKIEDSTKGTKNYIDLLKTHLTLLKQQRLPWSAWYKLVTQTPTKKSMDISENIRLIASDVEMHPRLHSDIRSFSEQIFAMSALAMKVYQDFKQKRGLLDFTDQEQLLYQVLECESVQEILQDELDLLLVDEFQDTSPIQLALFLRLTKFAKKVIWVGDIKQAIYGFRGSDPELMLAILKYLEKNGGKTEILEKSWRSRHELVHYINEIFVPAFSNTLQAERVALIPHHKQERQDSAVEHWSLGSGNLKKQCLALAHGIKKLVDDKHSIVDKDSEKTRDINYGDIAILCKTHSRLDQVSDALARYNIPIQRSRTGLLKTAEAALALAAVRYLLDPNDTLAIAEIISITDGKPSEEWLQERLEYLNEKKSSLPWGAEHPLLIELNKQRKRLQYLTPSEVMSQALHSINAREIVLRWDQSMQRNRQRLLNLDQLVSLSQEYEIQCGNNSSVATTTGLLLWFYSLSKDELDLQANDTQFRAVQLHTHHAAKGLEWPVVIAMDLADNIKSNCWGLTVQGDDKDFDITQPLNNRKLQYWTWPFGGLSKGIQVKERIEKSEVGLQAKNRAIEEAKRLLYVSLTRPRDLLIIPLKQSSGEWLDSVNADWCLPTQDSLQLPDSKINIHTEYKELEQSSEPDIEIKLDSPPTWLTTNQSITTFLHKRLSPSSFPAIETASVSNQVTLGERISISGSPDMALLGEALHAAIGTHFINPLHDCPTDLIEQVLTDYVVTDHIKVSDVLLCVERLNNFIDTSFPNSKVWAEYPIEYSNPNGQIITGWIDALIETKDGWIIIDHKSSPKSRDQWHSESLKYSGQLAIYKEALTVLSDKPVLSCWIHFAVTGGMIQVET